MSVQRFIRKRVGHVSKRVSAYLAIWNMRQWQRSAFVEAREVQGGDDCEHVRGQHSTKA